MDSNNRFQQNWKPIALTFAGIIAAIGIATSIVVTHNQTESAAKPPKPVLGDYVAFAWNTIGMKCVSDNDKYFAMHTPGNDLWVQVVKRGDPPAIVTDGIQVEYRAPENHNDPSKTINFWDYAKFTMHKEIPKNVGKSGNASDTGILKLNGEKKAFTALGIPISPYTDDGQIEPYVMYDVSVKGTDGTELIRTKAGLPSSAEVSCYKCHSGGEAEDGIGLSDKTARNILMAHDKNQGTNLLAEAEAGRPQNCLDCHSAANVNAKGKEGVLSMSAAMHGKHAQFMSGNTEQTCASCHPTSKTGQVRCERSVHTSFGMDCQSCHGTLEEHAVSLLTAQKELPAAQRLLKWLEERLPENTKVVGRTPWAQEPDCLSCHTNYGKTDLNADSYGHWTAGMQANYRFTADASGMMCASCHGSPHLQYPTNTLFGYDLNIQPVQYQGLAAPIGANGNCTVCHLTEPKDKNYHHPNMGQAFIAPPSVPTE
ncbi:cytochrome c [Heliophilum fasciatum]|uniref:Uncharacterized protein n=1 Tax=Heliophilum fasciatum TaxID=35700 RepID=A0A4R2RYS4_9FIRM|nr:cytochrome c [Heliophilum fasciatum]MCW2276855.1 hypothetical protein [Heliophilum fasciatum]TCP68684.1 hypothetical protein EDD73_10280 [Heliophilum fasciatum]